jgi:hypothetical protein
MEKPQIVLTEERNFSGVFNTVFGFIGQEFKPLAKTILLYASLPMILGALATAMHSKSSLEIIDKPTVNIFSALSNNGLFTPWYFLTAIGVAASYFMLSGLTFAYLKLYREKGSGNFEPSDVWQLFASKAGKLFGHQFIASFAMFFFFLLLIIPGIYVAIPLSFIMMIAMEEDVTFSENWGRCFYLTRNNWWITLGILLVIGIIHSLMAGILSLPTTIYAVIIGITKGTGASMELNAPFLIISYTIATLGKFLLYVMVFVAVGIQYYNLVEKKDKVSLLNKINDIATEEKKENTY